MHILSTDDIIAEIATEMDLRFNDASGALLSVLAAEDEDDEDSED